jgi:transcription termination factor Rho
MDTTMDRDTLGAKLLPELQQIAQGMGVEGAQKLRKAGLIDAIVAASTNGGDPKPTRAKRNGAAKADAAPVSDEAAAGDDDEGEDQEAEEGNRAPARDSRAETSGNDRGNQDRWQPGLAPRGATTAPVAHRIATAIRP